MKTTLEFSPTVSIEAEVTKLGLVAIHRPLDPTEKKRGYVLTHVPSLRVMMWVRLKKEAKEYQKMLEAAEDLSLFLLEILSHE